MGLGDLFKAKENAKLKERVEELEKLLSPELLELDKIRQRIDEASKCEEETIKEIQKLEV